MLPTGRGLTPIDDLCSKHGADLAFRLRAEYLPGDPPFPESAEEAEWLARRETMIVTVLRIGSGWRVQTAWTAGGKVSHDERDLTRADLAGWVDEVAASGGWDLAELRALGDGDGDALLEFEHEAYEYRDGDPDSLDLEAWSAPRHWRAGRGENGEIERTRGLVRAYARFLPATMNGSPVRRLIAG